MIADAALVIWVVNVLVGFTMLGRWIARHRVSPGPGSFPPPLAFAHLTAASIGLGLWIAYLATGRPGVLAWTAFVTMNVINALGDLLLTRGWRARHRVEAAMDRSGARDYASAVREALSGRRRSALAHGLLAGATFFLVLFAALGIGS